ncbi:MAG TPA: bifunctional acyl-ACP--phospholipid O-acyltransferase/long-chain-fatty-acid--ACP ligase [Nitrospirae bacterium]|nr:bifunctional acyl-ACP--phospholipid O-acyltransferase/long-chain-fatty-acid--ACP ligase [Nitrospirota bacterium]
MTLHKRFIEIAKENRKKLAFIDRSTDRKITYGRALIATLILARKFRKFEEGFIGIMIPTSAGAAFTVVGLLMSGRTPVMINYSTGAEKNAEFAQEKCGFKTVITSRTFLEKINCPVIDGMIFIEDIMEGISTVEKLRAASIAQLPAALVRRFVHRGNDDETAVILFTSGSEKEPRAVQLTHRNILSNIMSFGRFVGLSAKDRMFGILPFFHVFGFNVNLWTPLCYGMTDILYANPLDFAKVCTIAREERPTVIAGTPSFLWGYLSKSAPGDFESLRLIVSGADKCPDTLRKGYNEKHGITLLEGYGTTETSPVISANSHEYNRPGSIGKVLPGVEVRIENYETGENCEIGETGRILVKGDLVMKGYLDDLEETSMRVRHGWYDTGDMGYLDEDGYLWHAGRLKRFVKIGGEMVSLVRVEDVLESVLPSGIACCIVEVPDPLKGGKIVAAVTAGVDEKNILKKMGKQLPNIALPKKFVIIEELPKMGSGKIDFRSVTGMVHNLMHQK